MKKHKKHRKAKRMLLAVFVIVLVSGLFFCGRALWMLKTQVPKYREYWQNRASEPIIPDAKRYFALGDSAAQGVGASKPELGYVGLIAAELGETGMINISVSGARAKDVLDSQLQVLNTYRIEPDDYVTLEIGSNDMRSFNEEQFAKDMDAILKQMPPQTVVSDIPYFGGGLFWRSEKNALRANVIIAELVKKHNLRLAELHKTTKENNNWRNYAADWFHPSDRAYRLWADAFLVHLRD